jgi:hypothetical protein
MILKKEIPFPISNHDAIKHEKYLKRFLFFLNALKNLLNNYNF